eukprot:scaffold1425_cov333-Prasinococcus_capsulatus_cf.AAC.12
MWSFPSASSSMKPVNGLPVSAAFSSSAPAFAQVEPGRLDKIASWIRSNGSTRWNWSSVSSPLMAVSASHRQSDRPGSTSLGGKPHTLGGASARAAMGGRRPGSRGGLDTGASAASADAAVRASPRVVWLRAPAPPRAHVVVERARARAGVRAPRR